MYNGLCVVRTAICSEVYRWHPGSLSKWRWTQTPSSWSFPMTEDCSPDLAWQKCYIGMSQVTCSLVQRIKVVQDWPAPPKTQQLSDNFWVSPHTAGSIFIISLKLLHRCLAQKGVPFNWSAACAEALTALKDYLTQAPVLAYPRFDHSAGTFHLQTDACAVGLGAMLKQNGHPVAYASCALTSPEKCCHSKRMSRNNVCPKPILTLSIGWPFQNLDRSCTLSAFLLSATFCVLKVAMCVFTTCSLRTANIHAPATSPKLLCLPSLPALLVLEISLLGAKMLLVVHTWCGVALN